jgi:DNA-binding LacI/PurR family transcriptional regulator
MNIDAIARKAGVSAATVSLALNNRHGVSKKTRERILGIVKDVGYKKRSSRASQRGTIQFLKIIRHGHTLNEDHNVFIADYIDGITHTAKDVHLRVEFSSVAAGMSMNDLIYQMEQQDVAGFAVLGTELVEEEIRSIASVQKPVVFLDTYFSFLPFDFVDMDNLESVFLVVSRLVETGHRTIGMVTSPVHVTNFRLREEAFRECLKLLGCRFEEEYLFSVDSTYQGAWQEFAGHLRAGRHLPEGLFCCNDIVGLGVARALKDAGLRVPEDISLIGFDDLPASKHSDPPLTTIRVFKREIGSTAILLLRERIDHPEKPCSKVVIGGDLVARQSIRQRRTE